MTIQSQRKWQRGELYQLICMLGIAECVWLIGAHLELFPFLQELTLRYGLSDVVMLTCIMSVAFGGASCVRSFQLRREMDARAKAEAEAESLARHDVLTGLPNRRLLLEVMDAAMRTTTVENASAVLLIDLDRFKPVNDVHGHPAGDNVLCDVADRIKALLPSGALAARLGGDEFAVFLKNNEDTEDLMRLAQQIITALARSFPCRHTQVEIGGTIGIALAPHDARDPEALLRCADIAMYRAKREKRSTFRFFEQSMDHELLARAALEDELKAAISRGEIKPHFQPLVSLHDQKLLGFEVLARWYHPDRGVLGPDVFIAIAEDTGLITDLTYRLLRQACLEARAWPAHLKLAVNVSPYQLKDKWLPERLLAILTETGFAPGRFEVEITESALATDMEMARAILTSLQRLGVSIALDDFGTGYSSLYHLRELRFDKIKIDRSFVQSLSEDPESMKLVDAILGLGRSLGLLTTAEGIENSANSDWLAKQGCSFGQGYLFGAPMSASSINELLRAGWNAESSPEQSRAVA